MVSDTTEMVKHEIQSLHELVATHKPCPKEDGVEIKQCLSQLTNSLDRFILTQQETAKILEKITEKLNESKEDEPKRLSVNTTSV